MSLRECTAVLSHKTGEFILKEKLTKSETIFIASMLFGLFFGAGNLIFPIYMGQLAGANMWKALIGFLITGVGLPLLGIAAMGISRSDGLVELSGKVGRGYSIFFTCALYLTIGPFFAIPRCATVPFTVTVAPLFGKGADNPTVLAVYSVLFFAAVLAFSLFPGKILTWVGKILNPIFLVCLGILVIAAIVKPMGTVSGFAPAEAYTKSAVFTGFLDGYNTMDALASLAFGIVVITVIRDLGVRSRKPLQRAPFTPEFSAVSSWLPSISQSRLSEHRAADSELNAQTAERSLPSSQTIISARPAE